MNKIQARKMVLASIGVLTIIALNKERTGQSQQGTYRTLWGVAVVGMLLSLLADFVPQIAGPFAGLVVLGSLTHGGDKLIQQVLGTIDQGGTSAGAAGPPSSPGSAAPAPATSPPKPPVVGSDNVPSSRQGVGGQKGNVTP